MSIAWMTVRGIETEDGEAQMLVESGDLQFTFPDEDISTLDEEGFFDLALDYLDSLGRVVSTEFAKVDESRAVRRLS